VKRRFSAKAGQTPASDNDGSAGEDDGMSCKIMENNYEYMADFGLDGDFQSLSKFAYPSSDSGMTVMSESPDSLESPTLSDPFVYTSKPVPIPGTIAGHPMLAVTSSSGNS